MSSSSPCLSSLYFLLIFLPVFLLALPSNLPSPDHTSTTPRPQNPPGSPSPVLQAPYIADNDPDYFDDEEESPAALVYLVKNSDLPAWRRAQGPSAIVIRRGSTLFVHRQRRQAPGPAGGPSGTGGPGGATGPPPKIVTPVLPITGEKKFNATDCMPWEEVAVLLRDGMHPKHKSTYIEPRTCNMKEGLECLPYEDRGAVAYSCKCQLIYGPKPVYTNWTDNTGRVKRGCFIPAGLGWPSECFAKNWNNYGYPLPFGDPQGTNAEAAIQVDAYQQQAGDQLVVEYIKWNSVEPRCVPFSECRERGTYQGQRCQCLKGHVLEKPEGKCSGAGGMECGIGLLGLLGIGAFWYY